MIAFGLLILLFGAFAKWFHERWYFTQPLTAVVLGVLMGPAGLSLLTVLILLLRRPPIMLALAGKLGSLRTRKDTLFTAWFGPIGVSALF